MQEPVLFSYILENRRELAESGKGVRISFSPHHKMAAHAHTELEISYFIELSQLSSTISSPRLIYHRAQIWHRSTRQPAADIWYYMLWSAAITFSWGNRGAKFVVRAGFSPRNQTYHDWPRHTSVPTTTRPGLRPISATFWPQVTYFFVTKLFAQCLTTIFVRQSWRNFAFYQQKCSQEILTIFCRVRNMAALPVLYFCSLFSPVSLGKVRAGRPYFFPPPSFCVAPLLHLPSLCRCSPVVSTPTNTPSQKI